MNKVVKFLYKLFFTRDDDLDMLQVLFTVIVIVSLMVSWNIISATETDAVKIEALNTLRWLAGLLVVTAVPKWLIPVVTQIATNKPINTTSETTEVTHE